LAHGRDDCLRPKNEGWGKAIIPKLAADLQTEFPEVSGFSERNLGYMVRFYREYAGLSILQPAFAKLVSNAGDTSSIGPQTTLDSILPPLVAKLLWAHHVTLLEKIKNRAERFWYMQQAVQHGWSRSILSAQIAAKAHRGAGKAITNFAETLPAPQSDLAQQTLKDPYLFDFLTLATAARERDLEQGLIDHIQKFLVTLGVGFAFVGR
jgi:predicted nuclease of restriction endonuclease-like (RecB) superfamily